MSNPIKLTSAAMAASIFIFAGCKKEQPPEDASTPSAQSAATQDEPAKTQSPEEAHKVIALAGGYHNSFALLANGKVRAWGQAQHGELGNGQATLKGIDDPRHDAASAVEVALPGAAKSIAAGHPAVGQAGSSACAILNDGKVYCWGAGSQWPGSARGDRDKPTEVPELGGATQLAIGLGHGCALMGDGQVKCWGGNYEGEAGGGEARDVKVPAAVPGVSEASGVATGSAHSCAIVAGGEVMCWGRNSYGQSVPGGDKKIKTATKVAGIKDATQIAAGDDLTCIVDQAKDMTCWGLGKPPEQLATGVAEVAAGTGDHLCLRKDSGQVECWGDNNYGQLGAGKIADPYSSKTPKPVQGIKQAVALGLGYQHSCAALERGEVMCWGSNRFGELGDGGLLDQGAPTAVLGAHSPTPPEKADGFGKTPSSDQAQSFERLPKGCAHDLKLEGDHKSVLRDAFEQTSAVAKIDSKGLITVTLANYNMLKENKGFIDPRGDQLKTILYFLKIKDPKAKKEERLPSDKGDYSVSGKGQARYLGAMSAIYNSHNGYYIKEGASEDTKFTIKSISDDYVCGEISLDHKYGKLKGSFAAKVI